jgi:hypothetical protein
MMRSPLVAAAIRARHSIELWQERTMIAARGFGDPGGRAGGCDDAATASAMTRPQLLGSS